MEPRATHTKRRTESATVVLALLTMLTGCGDHRADNGSYGRQPPAPNTTSAHIPIPTPVASVLSITSSAFVSGAPIPAQFTCHGDNVAPPLTWSAPDEATLRLALVVDDKDAPGGSYIHWIVTDIPPGPGSTTDGQIPGNGHSLANSSGNDGYYGPCPPAGSGVHHYRFTLYQLHRELQLPPASGGAQAVGLIKQHAIAKAQLTGVFEG